MEPGPILTAEARTEGSRHPLAIWSRPRALDRQRGVHRVRSVFRSEPAGLRGLRNSCVVAVRRGEGGPRGFLRPRRAMGLGLSDDGVVEWMVRGTKFREGRFVMCIGCFETRLGRPLRRADFTTPPHDLFGTPPSSRFLARWGSGAGEDWNPHGELSTGT